LRVVMTGVSARKAAARISGPHGEKARSEA